ncbi:MAG: signal peptidase I [Ruminococcaceae bacterium]|nr:signal peptidase I [Oscillospiraceae bacterium]
MAKLFSTKGKRERPAPSYRKTALGIVAAVAVVLILLLNLFSHVFSVVQYYGDGMEPTLHDNQVLLIRKTDQVRSGDMIACYFNNKVLVRRVICEGGNSITVDETGAVWINNERLDEPYVETPSLGQCNISFPYTVSVGRYFVMGDNREIAMDSRLSEIGTVSADRILGKIIFVMG